MRIYVDEVEANKSGEDTSGRVLEPYLIHPFTAHFHMLPKVLHFTKVHLDITVSFPGLVICLSHSSVIYLLIFAILIKTAPFRSYATL